MIRSPKTKRKKRTRQKKRMRQDPTTQQENFTHKQSGTTHQDEPETSHQGGSTRKVHSGTTSTMTNNTRRPTAMETDVPDPITSGTHSMDSGSLNNVRRVTKSKRANLVSQSDKKRYEDNEKANLKALSTVYQAYYHKNGQRKTKGQQATGIYRLISKSSSTYLHKGVDLQDFKDFIKETDHYTVKGQRVGKQNGPQTNEESVVKGDYFHVSNKNKKDGPQDLPGRSRRIIVNVKTQEAALKVGRSLNRLFAEPGVGEYIRKYKVYLSSTPQPNRKVKYDKLVIYYGLGDQTDDGSDTVGDAIVSAISNAVGPGDVDEDFAPFYSRISPGIAWAEEPKYFVQSLQGSFTRTRANVIQDVIKSHPTIASEKKFVELVNKALEKARIDPQRPHRHLPDTNPI